MNNTKRIVLVSLFLLVQAEISVAAPNQATNEADMASYYHAELEYFGTTLPPGLSAKTIVALIAPEQDIAISTLVGVEAWSGYDNGYIAIACFAKSQESYNRERRLSAKQNCTKFGGEEDKLVYLGLLEYNEGDDEAELVARYDGPLDLAIDFGEGAIVPDAYFRFEHGPFNVTDTDKAFGLRFGWFRSTSEGDSAYWEALALFEVENNKLRNIFSALMHHRIDRVGVCNTDIKCEHNISDSKSFLTVSTRKTDEHYNLLMKNNKYPGEVKFLWNKEAGRYIQETLK